tara:strand:- start:4178 stop:5803 length:1626 start_codon:yes stop_codon:yes gene_type:complete
MASLFVKGMIGGALDEATERNRRRDDAIDKMTNLAIDNINQARKIQAERETLMKARENKAKRMEKRFGIDIDQAKAFLNDFDPNNTLNPLEIEKLYRNMDIERLDKLDASTKITPIVPGSGAMISPETTGGTFGDMFRMPTTRDAFTRAEEKLGLTPGEGIAAYEGATQTTRPNILETDYMYSFKAKPIKTQFTRQEEADIIDQINANVGTGFNAQTSQFTAIAGLASGTRADGVDLATSAARDASQMLSYTKERGTFNNGIAVLEQADSTTINYAAKQSMGTGFINNFGQYVRQGMSDTDYNNFLNSYKDIDPMYTDVHTDIINGQMPYAFFNKNWKEKTGKDIMYIDPNTGKEVSILEGNLERRPDFTVAQKLLIQENKLDKKIISQMEADQKEWDRIEKPKLEVLKEVLSPEVFNDVYLSIYGTGGIFNAYDSIDDGLASRGDTRIEDVFIANYNLGDKISGKTLQEHKETLAANLAGADKRLPGLSEEDFDKKLQDGLIPIISRSEGVYAPMTITYIAAEDMEVNGVKVKAGDEVKL